MRAAEDVDPYEVRDECGGEEAGEGSGDKGVGVCEVRGIGGEGDVEEDSGEGGIEGDCGVGRNNGDYGCEGDRNCEEMPA